MFGAASGRPKKEWLTKRVLLEAGPPLRLWVGEPSSLTPALQLIAGVGQTPG